jgi:type II secretory pathway component GspD/PulD (secretin)
MNMRSLKLLICRGAALALCGLAFPVLAQTTGRTGGGGGGGGGGAGRTGTASTASTSPIDRPGNGQVGSASFYVDKDTGQVFVIADDQTTAFVSQVISNLAKPKPQVLIKVVFLEVDYNKGTDIGAEASVTKHLHAGLTNTASSLFGLAAQGTTPTAGITSLPGAGMYTIVGDDFTATLRAIAEVGKVEVLSRPIVLARNNQMASIQVGYQIPVPSSVTLTTVGVQTGIQWLNVGIILNVTPNITADGMVEMILAPQISSVDPTLGQTIGTTSNGVPITVPAIAIESANTVVITPNGQTVVIGGLMKNSKSTTDSHIPLLGDIPGIGALFHHKVTSVIKQELIILLTPYVVRTPTDLARMSQDERGRPPMAPKGFSRPELNQYLESGQPNTPPPTNAAPPVAIPARPR